MRHCVLLVLLHLALGACFHERVNMRGNRRATFVKDQRSENVHAVKRRSAEELPLSLNKREVAKRNTDPGRDACKALEGYVDKLINNTHIFTFNDLSGSVTLAWVGDGTGVMLALTTFEVPFFMLRFGQSKLYRSENYGKSFEDVTSLINNTFILTEFGIAIGPMNSGKVILTGDVSGSRGGRIFLSKDFGKSFTHTDLPFQPLHQISYNPANPEQLLVLSLSRDLWLSQDFGTTWKNVHKFVCKAAWGRGSTIFLSTVLNGSCSDRGVLELRRTNDYGETFKTVANKIFSFLLDSKFVFASVMTGKGLLRIIHVSVDQGESWNIAQLPPVGQEQFYSILLANDDVVFMHVDEPGDTNFGTLYVSDNRGTVYSKSLERHLYSSIAGDTDFTNVTSLRGVYMTSVMAEDGSVQTVVTFDQGGEWRPLQKPENIKCESTAKDQDKCNLHIHASYREKENLKVPMLPVSEPNAVGLILAHGSVGDSISALTADVYVSDDGGYSWLRALQGPHHYAILDSGGLLVAVEHKPYQPIAQVKFSTDEGQCWHVYNFTDDPIYFTGLASEPGARSMNVSIWGYRETFLSQYWVSVTIDFEELLSRTCDTNDYVEWLAHSDDISDPTDGCMLGYKERFLRLRKDSVCLNGRDYVVNKQPTPCTCTLDDFLCDFGFYRLENSSECVEQPDLEGHTLEFCLHGKKEQLVTRGYRKIPGDQCQGGVSPERKEIDLSQKCVSNLLEVQQQTSSSSSVVIVIAVIIIMLLAVVASVVLIKKYVCGGRFLVHRYSTLQAHAAANGIEDVDQLDVTATQTPKIEYHDDSDEDLLE
ncbi:hypothetical protein GJAV_G00191930 [Gymnothorax javanicus]|nr:hypothetical protein GJAV_G00191930 [Gymnothorax javanicus]